MRAVRTSSTSMLALVSSLVLLSATSACTDRQSVTGVSAPAARSADAVGSDVVYGERSYQLTSFDVSTRTVSATSDFLPPSPIIPNDPYRPGDPYRTFTAAFDAYTGFVLARLDRYRPNDPYCPGLAADYNTFVSGVSTPDGFYSVIAAMAASHCNARVVVDLKSATIRSFQPVP